MPSRAEMNNDGPLMSWSPDFLDQFNHSLLITMPIIFFFLRPFYPLNTTLTHSQRKSFNILDVSSKSLFPLDSFCASVDGEIGLNSVVPGFPEK